MKGDTKQMEKDYVHEFTIRFLKITRHRLTYTIFNDVGFK